MQFFSGGSAIVDGGISEAGKDVDKIQFQQELSRLFESRGVIADLRSHLRHLMVTALQSAEVGVKPTDRSSPKAQALNLMIAEYLFRHRCHYTLSVFASEVPTLANFNLEAAGLQGGRMRPARNYFQESEVEEIFNALGLSSRTEELALVKRRYLEKDNQGSLVELFLQMTVELETKLRIQQNLESHVEGERILSKEWSSKVVDVLLSEKVAPSQVSALEEIIFRITEGEMRKSLEEQRKSQVQMLYMREQRIQEYLRRHEDEILIRLMEAEKELTRQKDAIEEEVTEREKHLTKMTLEWNEKHEEILRLSKKFQNIESESTDFKIKLKELEDENKHLKTQEESQRRTIHELREEQKCLLNKLKEATESNAVLSERLQVQMARESKGVLHRQDSANQATTRESVEIPFLWSGSKSLDPDSGRQNKKEPGEKKKWDGSTTKKELVLPQKQWSVTEGEKTNPHDTAANKMTPRSDSSEDGEDVSLASSFAEIIHGVQQKLQFLEEESNRLNQSYLEYKLKCISVDSDSESLNNASPDSPSPIHSEVCSVEAKFCQTNAAETFIKIQKLKETKETKFDFDGLVSKKADVSPKKPVLRTPTKRQLQNREFYLESRHLVQELERQRAEELQTSPSFVGYSASSSGEEFTVSSNETDHKLPLKPVSLTLLRTVSAHADERHQNKPPTENVRKALAESSNHLLKSDADCLALLEEARIKTPQASARRPLRQQMLLSESEKEEANEHTKEGETTTNFPKSAGTLSSPSNSSGKGSVGRNVGNDVA